VSDPDVVAKLGNAVVQSINTKLDKVQTALTVGGDQNAEMLGEQIGEVVYQIASSITGAGGAAKGATTLAKAGIRISKDVVKKAESVWRYDNLLRVGAGSIDALSTAGEGFGNEAIALNKAITLANEQKTLAKFSENNAKRTYIDLDLNISERALLAQERDLAEAAGWKRADGTTWWPPYDGAIPGTTKLIELGPSSAGALNLVDRFGRTSGSYVSPAGLSLEARALSSRPSGPPSVYSIDATISGVERATVIPWFGQKGLGVQYKLPNSVQYYLDNMHLGEKK
jgi:hypothetical protein